MRENENDPDAERLEQQEFNLNIEEQKRLEEQEVTRVMHTYSTHTLMKKKKHFIYP